MSKDLITVSEIQTMAHAVAKSGLFGVTTPEAAFSLMCIAQAEGLHPAIAARDYHIIKGKPCLKADAMLARFQQAGGSVKWSAMTDKKVAGVFSHPQGGSVEIDWTLEMARNAGLTSDTWKKYPRAMLRARCISEGIRTVFPGVVAGAYTPEEVEDFQDRATQEPKDITPERQEPTSDDFNDVITAFQAAMTKAELDKASAKAASFTGKNKDDLRAAYVANLDRIKNPPKQELDDVIDIDPDTGEILDDLEAV